MSILVTSDFPPDHGGIQRLVARLAQALFERGETVIVVAPKRPGSAAFDALQPYRVLRYPGRARLIQFLSMIAFLLWARIRSRDLITIASSWLPAGLAATILPRRIRGVVTIFAHGTEIAPTRGGVRRRLMRYVFGRADSIIANSRFTRQLLLRADVRRSVSIVNPGIDANPIAPAPSEQPTILSVGRLVPRKGFDTMINAMPAILRAFPLARYEIFGSGPQRGELEALAKRLALGESVIFHGATDDDSITQAYARAWLFALPVRAIDDDVEGFGMVYLEAALAQLPVIGGFNSGAEDAIVSGETGILVDGCSSGESAAAAIKLLSNRSAARAMGRRGFERAMERFTWSRVASDVVTVAAVRRSRH